MAEMNGRNENISALNQMQKYCMRKKLDAKVIMLSYSQPAPTQPDKKSYLAEEDSMGSDWMLYNKA